jgi:hypothetical protein
VFNENGDYIRTSGAYSGERSGIQITDADSHWYINRNGTEKTIFGVTAVKTNHEAAVGQGDSGGPVYSNLAPGFAGGRGVISAGDTATETQCPEAGVQKIGGNLRVCWWRFYYPDLFTTIDSLNVALNE